VDGGCGLTGTTLTFPEATLCQGGEVQPVKRRLALAIMHCIGRRGSIEGRASELCGGPNPGW